MRRATIIALLATICAAVVLAPGALAGKPTWTITNIATYGDGSYEAGTACGFTADVTYTGMLRRGNQVQFGLYRGSVPGTYLSASLAALGASPASATLGVATSSLTSGTYYFTVYLLNRRGHVLDSATTSTFSMSGCPTTGTALGSYSSP
jgi:hypothetical protein